jgi:PAS domain S-box-containing protein
MIAPGIPADESRRLRALNGLRLLGTPSEERFDRFARMAARSFQVPMAALSLVDEHRLWTKAKHGWDCFAVSRSESFCAHAILEPDILVVRDTTMDARFIGNPVVMGVPHVRFYAGHPLRAPDGSAVGALCIMDTRPRDFTDEDRLVLADLAAWAELELAAHEARQVRLPVTRLERCFEMSADMLALTDTQGRLKYFNHAWTQTLGYTADELSGVRMREFVHSEDLGEVQQEWARVQQGSGRLYFEARMRCHDGQWRWLQCHCVYVASEQLIYAVCRDITDRKRMEQERRRVEQLKDEFISTVSHELRTPLTSIRGALSLLDGGIVGPMDPEVGQMVRIAHKNTDRLLRLINEILDLDKMESGQLTLTLEPAELGELIRHAVAAHQGYAAQYGVRLEMVLEAPGTWAQVDGERFGQVLANLLSNAIKFSASGEQVVLRLEAEGPQACVSVEDHGPGIPEAFRSRIFQKFAQADGSDSRRRGGTGLGLAISRGLVERMGGTLDFITQEGRGTRFRVLLPAWTAAQKG